MIQLPSVPRCSYLAISMGKVLCCRLDLSSVPGTCGCTYFFFLGTAKGQKYSEVGAKCFVLSIVLCLWEGGGVDTIFVAKVLALLRGRSGCAHRKSGAWCKDSPCARYLQEFVLWASATFGARQSKWVSVRAILFVLPLSGY
mmetsp:Transcript_89540/g.149565  ORF Transcript_89540/g.149565 Transcript_89540/m.149565 type:complete len:142 (+) Transcript_89540:3989-4414(+)